MSESSISAEATYTLYCANHPDVETSLRCNRCEKPICPKCAVATPTGYRCRECVQGQQKTFETSEWLDYPVAMLVAAFLAAIGSFIAQFTWFFVILLAPLAGYVVAEAVRIAVRKRRSERLFRLAALGALLGCLPLVGITLINFSLWGILIQGFYTFTVVTSTYQFLKGIRIR